VPVRTMFASIAARRHLVEVASRAWLVVMLVCVMGTAGGAQAKEDSRTENLQSSPLSCRAVNDLRVRGGPGLNYPLVKTLLANIQVTADARNAEATWLRVSAANLSQKAWVLAGEVTCTGQVNKLPLPQPPPPPAPKLAALSAQSSGPAPYNDPDARYTFMVTAAIRWVIEYDVDRGGKDYRHFDLSAAIPDLCQRACQSEAPCQAYVYAEPGLRSERAHCWLKVATPAASAGAGFISGFKTYGAWEEGIDRPGSDLGAWPVGSPDECMNRCRADSRCAALTYVQPAVKGDLGTCWLKWEAPVAVKGVGMVSAVKLFGAIRSDELSQISAATRCAGNLVFWDDFERGWDSNWDADPAWRFESMSGSRVLRGQGHTWATVRGSGWGDYQMSTWLRLERGTIHLNVRKQGQDRYFLGFQAGNLYLKRQQGSNSQDLAWRSTPFQLGEWHLVQIAVRGGHIEVFVDGVEQLDYTDPNPLGKGTIAFETLENSVAQLEGLRVCAR